MKLDILKGIMRFAHQCKGKMILSVICSLISILGGMIPYYSTYKILEEFFNNSVNMDTIFMWVGIGLCGYILKLVFFGISTTLSHISAYTILETIRLSLAKKLLKAPLGAVLNKSVGKLKNLIVDRVETIELALAHLIPEGIAYIALPIGVFIYLLYINWIMALASLITFPIVMLIGPGGNNMEKQYAEYMKCSNYMNSVIVEYIEGIEVIKAFNQSGTAYEKFTNSVDVFLKFTKSWFKSTWKRGNFMMAVMPSTLLGTVPIGMYLYKIGNLSVTDFVMCVILSLGLVSPLMGLTTYLNSLKVIEFAVGETAELLDSEELPDSDKNVVFNDYNIALNNVSFSYDNKKKILNDISLKIPENSFTALVGPSGGGKSTIARMISRFWDVSSGVIKVGGHDIKDIPLSQLSNIVSYVAQDNFLFNCSIKENIRLGNPSATDEQVYEAAKAAQCDEFVSKLEKGYETSAGEAGGKLSGGEKQRIALARTMLKNSPIIILDEATAFTDPENEYKIQDAINKLTRGKTLLVIAHRLSTIKEADNIIVLKDGKVNVEGTHNELLDKSEVYKKMWNAHIGAKKWALSNEEKEEVIYD